MHQPLQAVAHMAKEGHGEAAAVFDKYRSLVTPVQPEEEPVNNRHMSGS